MSELHRAKSQPQSEYRTMIDRETCREELILAFQWLWAREGIPEAVLCIGTDRATGDALGPLVGEELSNWTKMPFQLFGTLQDPLHAVNLPKLTQIHPHLMQARCLAIDASLGRSQEVGSIAVGIGPIRPGAGVNKDMPPVGRYYATGTVNIGGFMDYYVLQNTRLALVMRMAHAIAEALALSLAR
jgi:putative sporulation protein YyaC